MTGNGAQATTRVNGAELKRLAQIGLALTAQLAKTTDSSTATEPRRLSLTKAEAAQSLGVSVDFLEEHVMPDLEVVRAGRRVLVPVTKLEAWLEQHAELTLG